MDIVSQNLYVLLSGRWYTANSQNGPWTYVAGSALPADFGKIPADSPKATVLANVPGTAPANNAVLDAAVPQTAAIKRNAAGPEVKYDGDPKFETAQGTSVQYAVNTSNSVLQVENSYYCCYDACWYCGQCGGRAVDGCAVNVPKAIYTIPPSCPVYNVTYCHVYESTPGRRLLRLPARLPRQLRLWRNGGLRERAGRTRRGMAQRTSRGRPRGDSRQRTIRGAADGASASGSAGAARHSSAAGTSGWWGVGGWHGSNWKQLEPQQREHQSQRHEQFQQLQQHEHLQPEQQQPRGAEHEQHPRRAQHDRFRGTATGTRISDNGMAAATRSATARRTAATRSETVGIDNGNHIANRNGNDNGDRAQQRRATVSRIAGTTATSRRSRNASATTSMPARTATCTAIRSTAGSSTRMTADGSRPVSARRGRLPAQRTAAAEPRLLGAQQRRRRKRVPRGAAEASFMAAADTMEAVGIEAAADGARRQVPRGMRPRIASACDTHAGCGQSSVIVKQ